jgi:hypothetical protein
MAFHNEKIVQNSLYGQLGLTQDAISDAAKNELSTWIDEISEPDIIKKTISNMTLIMVKKPTRKEVEDEFTNFDFMMEMYYNVLYPSIFRNLFLLKKKYENVNWLLEQFYELQHEVITKCTGRMQYIPHPNDVYNDNIKRLLTLREQLECIIFPDAKKFYTLSFESKSEDIINSYNLYDCDMVLYNYTTFKRLYELYSDKDIITNEEFYEWYDSETCSQWMKMDENGDPIEDWDLRSGAYMRNFEKLCELPYSRHLIKETIKIGCNTFKECVKHSNFICHHIEQIAIKLFGKEIKSLKSLCIEHVLFSGHYYDIESLPFDITEEYLCIPESSDENDYSDMPELEDVHDLVGYM